MIETRIIVDFERYIAMGNARVLGHVFSFCVEVNI